jgi:hypothetical protein
MVVCSVVEIPGVGEVEYNIKRSERSELSCHYIFKSFERLIIY